MGFYRYINMTGHNLTFINKYGEISFLESEGETRIEDIFDDVAIGLAVVQKKVGEEVIDLPQVCTGVFLIVNPNIKSKLKNRTDLVTSNSNEFSANHVLFETELLQ